MQYKNYFDAEAMKITGNIKLIFGFACAFLLISLKLPAQTENVQPKFKQVIVYIPKVKAKRTLQKNNDFLIDSLKNVIHVYDSMYRGEVLIASAKDSVINISNQKFGRQKGLINDLQQHISNYQTINLQTEKSNRILILFNSVVCLLLSVMLIRYLLSLRKKKSVSNEKRKRSVPAEITEPEVLPQIEIGHSLDQLERLGKLRNLGILTEEEFIFQKQLILGSSK